MAHAKPPLSKHVRVLWDNSRASGSAEPGPTSPKPAQLVLNTEGRSTGTDKNQGTLAGLEGTLPLKTGEGVSVREVSHPS